MAAGVRSLWRGPTPMQLLERSVLVFLLGKLMVLGINLAWFPTLKQVTRSNERMPAHAGAPLHVGQPMVQAGEQPRTALLVPMRNEADTLGRTLPGLLAAGFDEVIFLDDESEDGSAAAVGAWAATRTDPHPPVMVVPGAVRPPGWVGKTWACAQLAAATDAQILVVCDADVFLAPGAAASLLQQMHAQSASVFSVFCRQQTGSWSERLLTPLITDVVLCFLPFGLLSVDVPSAATASGALLAFDRSAYDRLGGFDAVRGELVEDLAMARRARRMGEKLGLALGGDLAQVRMYDGYRAVIHGMGRSLAPATGGRRFVLALGWAWHVIAYTLPVVLMRGSNWWRAAAATAVVERLIVEAKTGGRDWVSAGLTGVSPLAAGPVVAQAMRRRQSWKGRTYG